MSRDRDLVQVLWLLVPIFGLNSVHINADLRFHSFPGPINFLDYYSHGYLRGISDQISMELDIESLAISVQDGWMMCILCWHDSRDDWDALAKVRGNWYSLKRKLQKEKYKQKKKKKKEWFKTSMVRYPRLFHDAATPSHGPSNEESTTRPLAVW